MPSLNIPEKYRTGLAVLLALTPEQAEHVCEALARLPIAGTTPKEIASLVAPQVTDLAEEKLGDLVRVLFSLYTVRAAKDYSLQDLVDELIAAMTETGRQDLIVSDERRGDVISQMKRLLDVATLNSLAKASALQRDHEHIFHDAKIFTDLRPVFASPEQEPLGLMIEYTLKVVFHDGARHKEVYMAMDPSDVSALRDTIVRAQSKADSLKRLLSTRGISELPSQSEIQ